MHQSKAKLPLADDLLACLPPCKSWVWFSSPNLSFLHSHYRYRSCHIFSCTCLMHQEGTGSTLVTTLIMEFFEWTLVSGRVSLPAVVPARV